MALEAYRIEKKYPNLTLGDNVTLLSSKFEGYNSVANNSLISESSFGLYSYSGNNAFICRAKIGRFTCIGPNVSIGLANHPVAKFGSVHPAFYSTRQKPGPPFVKEVKFDEISKEVIIGNDVWIGAGVIIPGGIEIGNGAVIAAGSVVTKNISAFEIFGGVPAKKIKDRFDSETVAILEKTAWWEKEEEWLKENGGEFENVQDLIKIVTGHNKKEI
jgi:acetyltransferase-like isoleucine patch superfamily enzyme